MRRNVVAVGMCMAGVLAVVSSALPAAASSTVNGAGNRSGAVGQGAAPRASGVVTGVVLGASGRALAGACVTATRAPGGAAGASSSGAAGSATARTSAGGRYFLGGLAAGQYSLRYHSCTHPAQPGGATREVVVSGGQIVRLAAVTLGRPRLPGSAPKGSGPVMPANTGITRPAGRRLSLAALRASAPRSANGGISGRVTDTAGRPIEGLCASASPVGGGWTLGMGTSALGTYRSGKSLPAGRYIVQFGSCPFGKPAGNWAPQWFRGKYSQARANTVRVRAGQITRGIDAAMRRGGVISGLVTGKGGAPVSRVCVTVATADGKQYVAQAETVRGRYRIASLDAGRYRVYFDPACGYHATPYLGQWWPGATTLKASKPVAVQFGKTTGHVNAALRLGGTITGSVRLQSSRGKLLAGICVFGTGLGRVSSVERDGVTRKNGTFTLEGLPAGRYQLSFGAVGCGNRGNYLYLNDPHPVRVGLGQTAHVAVFMQPGAIISGTVTSAATGQPLAGICVSVNDHFGDGTVTRADGTFRVNQIQPGRYSVGFFGGCGSKGSYAPQWFRGRSQPFNAARVTFRGGRLTAGIDAAMRAGSGISGTVSSTAGAPLGRICIGAYTPAEAGYLFGVFGDFYNGQAKHGAYQISNLAPGQYQIVFFSCGTGPGWTSQWYRSAASLRGAGLLDVPSGTTVTGVNAVLAKGGAISGTVRGVPSQAIAFNCIVATNLVTGTSEATEADASPSGLVVHYGIGGLDPGRYRVEFSDCGGGGGATQWYSDKSRPSAADPVGVAAGHVTTRIDALLAKPPAGDGSISGRVTSRSTGKPVAGVCVTASVAAGVYRTARSNAHGDYAITQLASGRYRLAVASCRGYRYAYVTRPGRVRVRAPGVVRGVDVVAVLAGSISGAVNGGSPEAVPRPAICVSVVPSGGGGLAGFAVTGRGGRYVVRGLVPGWYHVHFDPVACTAGALPFAPRWYGGQASPSGAAAVTVRGGSETTGIGATLVRDGSIAGAITGPGPGSPPLAGICVQAVPAGALVGSSSAVYTVSQAGRYSLAGLPPGKYLVSFASGCGASGYASQWWQGVRVRSAATPVTVASGSVTDGIDAAMRH